jgi:predicted CoA-binding protein
MAADKLHDSGIVLMMSGIGTKRSWRRSHRMSVVGGNAENIHSGRVFRILTQNGYSVLPISHSQR